MIKEAVGGWVYPAFKFTPAHFYYMDVDNPHPIKDSSNSIGKVLPDNHKTL